MKLLIAACLLVAASLLAGCVSQSHGLVLDPIGPPNPQLTGAGLNGTLMVFSAFDPLGDFNDLPYHRHYTDYKLESADGKLLQTVHNDSNRLMESPKRLQLSVGAYRVVARANGYGMVTVPVVIQADAITTVHLEGSSTWLDRGALRASNPVRLPNGDIVGWRASQDNSFKP
jgi:hypothetical protein